MSSNSNRIDELVAEAKYAGERDDYEVTVLESLEGNAIWLQPRDLLTSLGPDVNVIRRFHETLELLLPPDVQEGLLICPKNNRAIKGIDSALSDELDVIHCLELSYP